MKYILLWLLGISIPFSVRTTLFADTIRTVENPFLTVYLYASDLIILSILAGVLYSIRRNNASFDFPVWYIATMGAGVWSVWVSDYPWMSFLMVLQVLGSIYVYIYAHYNAMTRYIWYGFELAMIIQLGIVFWQFGSQSSIGLPLVIEPVLNASLAGVAKISVFGEVIVRASGTFPHANILACALGVLLWQYGMKYLPTKAHSIWKWFLAGSLILVSQLDHYFITSTQGILLGGLAISQLYAPEPLGKSIRKDGLIVLLASVALVLTFSKSLLGLALIGGLVFLTLRLFPRMFHVEHFEQSSTQTKIQMILGGVSLSFVVLVLTSFLPTASNRLFYLRQAFIQFRDSLGLGVGFGRFVSYLPEGMPFWRYQPAHSLSLLLISEIGIGLVMAGILFVGIRYYMKYE